MDTAPQSPAPLPGRRFRYAPFATSSVPLMDVDLEAQRGRMLLLLLFGAFVVSGAAGLIYESIWSRYLGQFVGHSAYAQIIVLVIFLGGMALGALWAGRRSERLREPLLWYAGVEAAVAVLGLVFHSLFTSATRFAYDVLFPAIPEGGATAAATWLIAAALILPQSLLLGTTFPLMSAGVLRRLASAGVAARTEGRALSLLYFCNSIGAAVGVLFAGFWLVARFGLPGTLVIAAMLNAAVAALVVAAVRAASPEGELQPAAPDAGVPDESTGGLDVELGRAAIWRLLLAVSFGTAVASFIYEIAWIRMLSLVLGSATHSFELMLSGFILGLALGALWMRQWADRIARPIRALAYVQILMGILAVATLPFYLATFRWTAALLDTVQTTDRGYLAFTVARYAFVLAVMLPATFCAGMTLPLITKTLLRAGTGERAIGAVYGLNTLGSIVGVMVAGLLLMPVLGLKLLLMFGAALDVLLGLWLLALARRRAEQPAWRAVPATTALLAAALFVLVGTEVRFDRMLLTSGVFRFGTIAGEGSGNVVFYRDGRTATVSVRRAPNGGLSIATNGKPDASLGPEWFTRDSIPDLRYSLAGDASTQLLLGVLAIAHAPEARTGAVIGQGSGMTSHVLLASPTLERLVTIDIEPEMIRGSRHFRPANERVFDDPRSELVVDDAKAYFSASRTRYDLIVSEPSNPWVSGVSSLFTTEFYARVRRHLTDDGIFGQWLHLYEITDDLVLTVLAALHQHFRAYDVYLVARNDLYIIAAAGDSLPAPDWSVLELPGFLADVRHAHPVRPHHLDAAWVANRRLLAPLVTRVATPNSDFRPVLDLGTERARFSRREAAGLVRLSAERFDLAGALTGRRRSFIPEPVAPLPGIPRAQALALGARLRMQGPDSLPVELAAAEAAYRLHSFEAVLASGRAPASWRLWLRELHAVESLLHGGTAGVADDAFYGRVASYAERADAPDEVRLGIRFMHALARWEFAEAGEAADALAETWVRWEHWLPPGYLRDGAVAAKLALGDVEGARRAFETFTASHTTPGDFTTRLLRAYLASLPPTVERAPELHARSR